MFSGYHGMMMLFKAWAIQEIKSLFEYQKQHPDKMDMARKNPKSATLIRFHIYMEDCYADPLLRNEQTLVSWFSSTPAGIGLICIPDTTRANSFLLCAIVNACENAMKQQFMVN